MKNLLDQNYKIHKFKSLMYLLQLSSILMKSKIKYIEIPNKDLTIKKDFFAARFPEYELGFQINEFEVKNPVMSMSKYDYKNDKFLDQIFM